MHTIIIFSILQIFNLKKRPLKTSGKRCPIAVASIYYKNDGFNSQAIAEFSKLILRFTFHDSPRISPVGQGFVRAQAQSGKPLNQFG